jgi:hypothetical protein
LDKGGFVGWMVGFGNDLTRERSFDQNVIHEHVLQIGIIA